MENITLPTHIEFAVRKLCLEVDRYQDLEKLKEITKEIIRLKFTTEEAYKQLFKQEKGF